VALPARCCAPSPVARRPSPVAQPHPGATHPRARPHLTPSRPSRRPPQTVAKTEELVAGHLKKETIKEGAGALPARGQTVTAHYDGRLTDGTQFDASAKRGRPFQFKIGIGQVIKGWDVGMATMKPGETAVFTISPEYGYGAAGAGGVIPPGATLVFKVDMISSA